MAPAPPPIRPGGVSDRSFLECSTRFSPAGRFPGLQPYSPKCLRLRWLTRAPGLPVGGVASPWDGPREDCVWVAKPPSSTFLQMAPPTEKPMGLVWCSPPAYCRRGNPRVPGRQGISANLPADVLVNLPSPTAYSYELKLCCGAHLDRYPPQCAFLAISPQSNWFHRPFCLATLGLRIHYNK